MKNNDRSDTGIERSSGWDALPLLLWLALLSGTVIFGFLMFMWGAFHGF